MEQGSSLFLLFRLGAERYSLDAATVVEVIPLIAVTRLPGALPGVAGVINYRGNPVPVLDLAALARGERTPERISTRILIVTYNGRTIPRHHHLGLVAEQVTDMLRCESDEFKPSGVETKEARYLGPVRPDRAGLIQRVEPQLLLSPEMRDALFPEHAP
jgi:chemotaxis-related protein WspB